MKKTYYQPRTNKTLTLSSEIMQTFGISAPVGLDLEPLPGDEVR